MKDLKCSLRECEFNEQFNCAAKCITVSGGADCASYRMRDQAARRNLLFEIGSLEYPSKLVDTEVLCEAEECTFNKSQRCHANGITVLSEKNSTTAACATYLKK